MATETPTDTLELRGPLPEDFPGYAALVDAGVDTYGKVRKQKNLADIAGIGPVTAEKITLALAGGPQNAVEAPADTPLRPAVAEPSTSFEAPASPVKVVCPECGVGGELAGDALLGTATCGNPDHPDTVLVRAT